MSPSELLRRNVSGCAAAILMGLVFSAVRAQSADGNNIVLVTRRSAEIQKISVEQVSRLFLGLTDTLPNGLVIVPVDAPEGSALYLDFYNKVVGKTSAQIKAHRARQSFTGSGVAPRQASTPALAFKLDTNASIVITYIRKRDLEDQHQIVLETGK